MSWLSDQWESTKKNVSKYNNRKFKNAAMAICARVANSDGTIQDEEKATVAAVIGGLPELAAFDPVELYKLFEEHCNTLKSPIGKIATDRAIAGIKGDAGSSAAAIQVALAVANADGKFEPCEKQAVKECCAVLGVDAGPYIS